MDYIYRTLDINRLIQTTVIQNVEYITLTFQKITQPSCGPCNIKRVADGSVSSSNVVFSRRYAVGGKVMWRLCSGTLFKNGKSLISMHRTFLSIGSVYVLIKVFQTEKKILL